MPREFTLVSTEPLTTAALVEAAVRVDGSLVPRLLFDGWVTQLIDTHDEAVVSIELSRQIIAPYDVERLTGALPTTGPVWWTEATAPWGPAGEPGQAVMRALAEVLGARLTVADGR